MTLTPSLKINPVLLQWHLPYIGHSRCIDQNNCSVLLAFLQFVISRQCTTPSLRLSNYVVFIEENWHTKKTKTTVQLPAFLIFSAQHFQHFRVRNVCLFTVSWFALADKLVGEKKDKIYFLSDHRNVTYIIALQMYIILYVFIFKFDFLLTSK